MWSSKLEHREVPWETYYDNISHQVFEKTNTGWNSYVVAAGNYRRPTCPPTTASRAESGISPNAAPADIQKDELQWRILYTTRQQHYEEQGDDSVSETNSFTHFISSQGPNIRRLLHSIPQEKEMDWDEASERFAALLKTPGSQIIGASDGGLKLPYGAFGWIWTDQEEQTTISGYGPSDARPHMHSSTRTEITGIIAALTVLSQVIH
jgi:hypothetical protein